MIRDHMAKIEKEQAQKGEGTGQKANEFRMKLMIALEKKYIENMLGK